MANILFFMWESTWNGGQEKNKLINFFIICPKLSGRIQIPQNSLSFFFPSVGIFQTAHKENLTHENLLQP